MPHKTRVSQASQIESSTALERLEKSVGLNICTDKRYDSIGSAPAGISRSGLNIDPGALSIGAFGRSRWRLRRTRAIYGFELGS